MNLNVKALSSDEGIEICHTLPSKATGYIEYYLNDTLIGTLSVNKNLELPSLNPGHYVLVAKYCGDKNYNSSYGTVEINVNSRFDDTINPTLEDKDDSSTEVNKEISTNLDNNYSSADATGEVVVSNTKDLTNSSNSTSPVKSIDSKSNGNNFNFLWLLLLILLIAGFAILIKKYNK